LGPVFVYEWLTTTRRWQIYAVRSLFLLGKLAARLIAVFGFVASTVPLVALGARPGGIEPLALAGSFLVVLGLAVLETTLSFVLPVWASRMQRGLARDLCRVGRLAARPAALERLGLLLDGFGRWPSACIS
jgi:hypothetical protein